MDTEKKSNGAFVGLVIIIIILAIGGIYIWLSNQKTLEPVKNSSSTTVTNQDAATLDSLQQDSNVTDTSTGVDTSTIN